MRYGTESLHIICCLAFIEWKFVAVRIRQRIVSCHHHQQHDMSQFLACPLFMPVGFSVACVSIAVQSSSNKFVSPTCATSISQSKTSVMGSTALRLFFRLATSTAGLPSPPVPPYRSTRSNQLLTPSHMTLR